MIDQYLSPAEFRRLLSTLLVAVGAIAIFVLFAFIVVPGLRNANQPKAAPPVAAPQGETGWLDPAEYPPARGYDVPPIDPQTVMTANPDLLQRGRTLYEQNCAACHGPDGQGNGPGGAGINPPPRNFTKAENWKNGAQLTSIVKTLREGIRGSAMSSYDYLAARDRMALAHYVQSLGTFPRGSDDPAALDALAQQFASGGERVPNRIPVSRAMGKLEQEFTAAAALAPPGNASPDALAIFARAVRDRTRVGQTLAQAKSWRDNPAALAKIAAADTPANGFAVSVATLSPADWQSLYDALVAAAP